MNIFTQKKIWLSVVMTLAVCTAFAQHGMGAFDVEPGTKGALPETPTVAPAQEGQIKCLELYCVGVSYTINGYHYVRADLRWPESWSMDGLESLEATSCTVQYRQHGTTDWVKYEDFKARTDDGGIITGCSPSLEFSLTDFRLVLHGGKYDGWVSNVVTAKSPSMYSGDIKWGADSWVDYNIVGKEVGNDFTVSVATYKDYEDDAYYTTDDGYYTYQWYRRNPNTWEMTAISGATKRAYTPVTDDAGYELVLDVSGDDIHCSFTLRYNFGKTYVAVQGSVEQFFDDGFILNTDYILPDPKNNLIMVNARDWGEDHKNGETMDVTERKPGQYAIRMDKDDYSYRMINIAGSGYTLAFVYDMGNPQPTYREAQLLTDRYIGQFNVKAQLNGVDVPETTIDVLTKNIDGKETIVASKSFAELGRDMVSFELYKGTYYLKARKTDAAMETYYPSTLLWSEAEAISPQIGASQQGQPGGKDYGEEGEASEGPSGTQDEAGEGQTGQQGEASEGQSGTQDEGGEGQSGTQEGGSTEQPGQKDGAYTRGYEVTMDEGSSSIPTFTIAMLATPAPLTGIGVIEGTVVLNEPAAGTRGDSEAETETCKVYLKAKDAEIVAQTETDANGKFRFENVPFGDYQVLLDVEGRAMKSVQEVAVTEEAPEVAELDYVITDTEIVTKEEYIASVTDTAPITIGKSGKASYCGDKSLDFSFSDKIKAYIATGFDKDEGTIWLTRVKDVPAGVPVLIKGEADKTYDVPVTDSQNSYYTNMFVGNTSGETVQITETDGNLVNYYLSGDGTFKSVNKSANIGNNKCYLQLPGTFEPAVAGETQKVTIKASGKASYAAPVDLDFTNVEGLKAFSATGYDKSTKTIWLTRMMKVQKGEGVLLKGDAKDYEIPSAAIQSSYMNMFVGNTSGDKVQVQETSADGSQTNFYLNGDGSFVSVNGFVNIGNNKCYLELPTSMVAVASTRGAEANYLLEEPEVIKLPISFRSIDNDGDGTTGIKDQSSKFNAPSDNAYYTLQGQRVAKPGKGLYIRNGKVVVVR